MKEYRIKLPSPHDGQQQLIDHQTRFNIVACGRRWGKTTIGGKLIIETALAGHQTAWFAPIYKDLAEVWRDIKQRVKPITASINTQEHRIELITGGVIDMWSLENKDAGRGRKYKRIIIDEAAKVKTLEESWNAAIRPTLTDYKGDAFFLSTPKGMNFFWNCYSRGLSDDFPDWRSWHMPTVSNPYIDPAEVEAAKRDIPERIFQQEYLAEFIEDAGGVFRGARDCVLAGYTDPPSINGFNQYLMGVDLAKTQDFTVITVLDNTGRQVYFERFNQISWTRQIETIKRVASQYHALAIIDSTGLGDPIFEELRMQGVNVIGFKITASSKEPLINRLAIAIEHQELTLMDIPEQTAELLAYEYDVTPSGHVTMNAPEGMHDDTVIALALAASRLTKSTGITITTGSTKREAVSLWDS